MTGAHPVPPAAVDALRRTVDGLVAYPTDAAYEALRAAGSLGAERPDVVVVPSSEAGVCAAVAVARAHGLRLAGPSAGAGPVVLVLTHRLSGVVVDRVARTVTVRPGATWACLAARTAGTGLCVEPGPGARDDPRATVVGSVSAGTTAAVSARVVRADGFVHVVDRVLPPPGGAETWIVTAVVLRLNEPARPLDVAVPAT